MRSNSRLIIRIALAMALYLPMTSCKKGGDNSSIVIPPGQELTFSTAEFLKYADANFEMKLRSVTTNKTLTDITDLTAISTADALSKTSAFRYIIPKMVTLNGLIVVDIVSKSTSLSWKAFVLDPTQPIEPSVETTLLYDLVSNYDAKDIKSYSLDDLKDLLAYIQKFSADRQELFGVTGTLKPVDIYRFVRNGLSSDLVFLNKLKPLGLTFDVDAHGNVLSAPYPFGLKNNQPIIDEARTTPTGDIGALETIRVDVHLEARDPDGDHLFYYFEYLEDGSITKDVKIWSWTPSYTDSRATPYKLRAFMSDGSMEPIELDWSILVADNNRPPTMTSNCPSEVTEGTTWVCDLDAVDPDGDDKVRFSLIGVSFPYAVPLINGTPWVLGTQYEVTHLHVEWTPTNRDFIKAKPLTMMQFLVSDYTASGVKKNGDVVQLYTLTMKGINSAPYPVAGPAGTLNWNTPINDPPRVLDTTFMPGGVPYDPDTRTPNKKFYFEVVLVDDDNQTISSPAQYDLLTLRVNSGAELINAEPDATSNMSVQTRTINGVDRIVTVFKYSWQPTTASASAVVSFTPTDDMQNGQGKDFSLLLTSLPRTQLPSCTIAPTGKVVLNSIGTTATFSAHCPDLPQAPIGTLNLASAAAAAKILPFMRTTLGAKFATLTRKVGATNYTISEQNYGNILAYNFYFASQTAGAIRFVRSGVCDATNPPSTVVNIPLGTKVVTSYVESPYQPRVNFQTAIAAQLGLFDCEVIVPVTTVSRTAAINQLSVIYPVTAAMLSQGLNAKNSVAVAYDTATTASITFTRAITASALTIPAGTQIRTNEPGGIESITYVVPSDTVMAPGLATLTVTVARDWNSASTNPPDKTQTYYDKASGLLLSRIPVSPTSGLTWAGAPIAGVTVGNPASLYPRNNYTYEVYKNSPAATSMNFLLTFTDGSLPALNEISIVAPNGLEPGTENAAVLSDRAQAGFDQIHVRNPAWTDPLSGTIEFYQTVNGPTLHIPAGLVVATLDRKLYQVLASGSVSGAGSVMLPAGRVFEATYRPASLATAVVINDINTSASFVNFPVPANINANIETAFKIEVTDNGSVPLAPKDPFDRYYVKEYKVTTGPSLTTAKVKMCREMSGGCTPCNQTPASPPPATDPYTTLNLGGLSHEDSRFCYFRVTPDTTDVAQTYRYNINVCDYGQFTGNLESCTAQDLQFYVLEQDTQPYFTNAHNYGTTTPGTPTGSTTAANLGAATSTTYSDSTAFNEGQFGSYTVYAYDADKDAGNKSLWFDVLPQVYHLKPGDLGYRATPAGLKIDTTSIVNTLMPSGTGNMAKANLIWTPTDDDSKIFSSAEGFIVGIKVYDNKTNASLSKNQILYVKVKLVNFNNTPVLSSIGAAGNANTYSVLADTYFKQTFTASDLDRSSPVGKVFQTMLSACWNADGGRNANAYFDAGNLNPDICHLNGPEWTANSFDPAYTGNSAVSQCRIGSALKVDLAAPKITRIGGPTNVSNTVQFSYQIEWCPQKKHIGNYSLGIQVFDNGDMDVQGNLAPPKGGYAPLYLKVIAPVFLMSPQMDTTGTVTLKSIRQTAANITAYPFTYQVLAKNSKGNPLTYSILSSPRACALPNGVCIDSNSGLVTWLPAASDVTDGTAATNKKIVVQSRDTVTGETATGTINLWVQDPTLYPGEQGPSILSANPGTAAQTYAKEMSISTYTVTATDANFNNPNNNDKLFARFYIDGVVKDDAEMTLIGPGSNWSVSFDYKPAAGDGSVDLDGAGPMLVGQHKLMIEVTDGNLSDTRQWMVNVRNTIPQAILAFDLVAERKALDPISITWSGWTWGSEAAGNTVLSGKKYESLYLSGSYVRAGVTKYYLWALDLVNGVVTKTASGGKWSFNENLNWGALTRRLSFKTDPVTQVNDIFMTNLSSKYGPFTTVTNSLKMNGDLTRYSNPLPTSLACNGCASSHYQNVGYGNIVSVTFNGNRNIYSGGATLLWDTSAAGPALTVSGWPAGYTVAGLAVNAATKRLYVSATKSTLSENKVIIYDLSPTLNATPSSPVKLTELDVSAQAGWSIQAPTMPGDIVVDSSNTFARTPARIFVYLRGTGGLITFTDSGSGVPAQGSLATIGLGSIPSSASDVLATGTKLIYDPRSDLVWGISKEARVIYSIDPVTFEIVQKPTPAGFDAIWILPTGTAFLTDRANSRVYIGQ